MRVIDGDDFEALGVGFGFGAGECYRVHLVSPDWRRMSVLDAFRLFGVVGVADQDAATFVGVGIEGVRDHVGEDGFSD